MFNINFQPFYGGGGSSSSSTTLWPCFMLIIVKFTLNCRTTRPRASQLGGAGGESRREAPPTPPESQ